VRQPYERDDQTVDIQELLRTLRRRWRSVALLTVIAIGLAFGYVAWRPPVYTSMALVEVRPLTIDEQLQPFASDAFVNMDTEAARVMQDPVASDAASALGIDVASPADRAELLDQLTVGIRADTTFLEISCTQGTATFAQRCAQAFATAYVQDRVDDAATLYEQKLQAEFEKVDQATAQIRALGEERDRLAEGDPERAALDAQIEAQRQLIITAQSNALSMPTASPKAAVLAQSADPPREPSNKDYLFTGALVGVVVAALLLVLTLLRERLAQPITALGHFEGALMAPVLALVPEVPSWRGKRATGPVTLTSPESPASQAFKTARSTLLLLGAQVILVTSPGQGEGKTSTTANLGVALAQGGKRVAIVSCDLRRPRLHRLFDRDSDVGLTDVLRGSALLDQALIETHVPRLHLLPSGPSTENPSEMLGSDAMTRLLDELRLRFDFILLDTAPAIVVADAFSLVPLTDGVIVVAQTAKTRRSAISHVRRQFERMGAVILGGVLNVPARQAHLSNPYYGGREEGLPTLGLPGRGDGAESKAPDMPQARHD
jgi:polysaccharide biosynthesis transport protein